MQTSLNSQPRLQSNSTDYVPLPFSPALSWGSLTNFQIMYKVQKHGMGEASCSSPTPTNKLFLALQDQNHFLPASCQNAFMDP